MSSNQVVTQFQLEIDDGLIENSPLYKTEIINQLKKKLEEYEEKIDKLVEEKEQLKEQLEEKEDETDELREKLDKIQDLSYY